MFGTLKPHLCVLDQVQRTDYDRFYCGLCAGLGEHYGTAARALLHHDAVFMALLVDGLQGDGGSHGACRCPLVPVVKRPTVTPESAAMRYAAAMQVLLGDQWLADREQDGRLTARAARGLISGRVARARALLERLGLPAGPLDGFELRQARREVLGVTTPEEAAEPTASALGYVFSRIADLPGGCPEAETDAARGALCALGEAVGRAIYHRDALEDLQRDYLSGAFNPCVVRDPDGALRVSPERVEDTIARLQRDVASFASLLDALPLQRHGALLRHILCGPFSRAATQAVALARSWSQAHGRRLLEACRASPWYDRVALRAAMVLLALLAWLSRVGGAFAQQPPGGGQGLPASGVPGPGLPSPSVPSPSLPSPSLHGPSVPHPGTPHGGGACDDAKKSCGDACCNSCSSVCGECAKPCGDCGRSCSGCGHTCDGCGRDCGGCGNACSGCGDCGSACNSCGNCGSACNGCRC